MTSATVVPVVVVDDQAPFRSAARAVLRCTNGFELVGEAESGEQAIELVTLLHPRLVLMDINLPGMDGVEATRRILAEVPGIVVFLCSTYQLGDLPPEATTSGASTYVNKEEFAPSLLRRLWDEHHIDRWRSS